MKSSLNRRLRNNVEEQLPNGQCQTLSSHHHPSPGSPMVDHALAGQIPATDILGQARDPNFASLGAVELGSLIAIFSDGFESLADTITRSGSVFFQ